jgi:hypothetical protein
MLPTINTPDRQAEAFPVLTPAQIDRLRPYGNIRSVRAAEVLFEPGKSGMRAFLLRRVAMISGGLGNVAVPGSQHSSNTLRLREFLTRNSHPYRYVDLDSDKASQELLDRFDIKLEDIPVVICSGKKVLRNPENQKLAECLGFTDQIDEHRIL